jgi:hypothetical protein
MPAGVAGRRFPRPWSVEETDACFIVRDSDGQALALQGRKMFDEPGETKWGVGPEDTFTHLSSYLVMLIETRHLLRLGRPVMSI